MGFRVFSENKQGVRLTLTDVNTVKTVSHSFIKVLQKIIDLYAHYIRRFYVNCVKIFNLN